jgi:hypothetical protein
MVPEMRVNAALAWIIVVVGAAIIVVGGLLL